MCCFNSNGKIHVKALYELRSSTNGWYFINSGSSDLNSWDSRPGYGAACSPVDLRLSSGQRSGRVSSLWSLISSVSRALWTFLPWFFSLTYLLIWVLVLHRESYHRHRHPRHRHLKQWKIPWVTEVLWRSFIQNKPPKSGRTNLTYGFNEVISPRAGAGTPFHLSFSRPCFGVNRNATATTTKWLLPSLSLCLVMLRDGKGLRGGVKTSSLYITWETNILKGWEFVNFLEKNLGEHLAIFLKKNTKHIYDIYHISVPKIHIRRYKYICIFTFIWFLYTYRHILYFYICIYIATTISICSLI